MREFMESADADLPTWLREILAFVILALFLFCICALFFGAAILLGSGGPAW